MKSKQIPPGSTICILGDGQLGMMSLVAAKRLGFKTMVWYPSDMDGSNGPAMDMATYRLCAPFNCPTTIDEVARNAAVVTTEWENVSLDLIRALEKRGVIVRPGSRVLEVAQSRIREKVMARELDIPTTRTVWIPANLINWDSDRSAYLPGILKTDGQGYDGKGQYPVSTVEELIVAQAKAGVDCVLEKRVDFAYELSVLVARTTSGSMSVSHVVQNSHLNGILDQTEWPLRKHHGFVRTHEALAQEYAMKVAEHLGLEGVLYLEFFVDREGNLLFNEMAPRPHNSFHGSIEAAYTSQFE